MDVKAQLLPNFIGGVLVGTLVFATAVAQQTRSPRNLGLDDRTRQLLIESPLQNAVTTILPSASIEALADQVTEVRLFLTNNAAEAIGEIETQGPTTVKALAIPLEKNVVRFLDDGKAPDKKPNDGVFTARFAMDTAAAFKRQRDVLRATAPASTTTLIRRGPRDLVPVQSAAGIAALNTVQSRFSSIVNAQDPRVAARNLNLDTNKVPFLSLPVQRFGKKALTPSRLFDVSFFPPIQLASPSIAIDEFRSLIMVDTKVLDDPQRTYDACTNTGTPGGSWSFGHLMREMSHGTGLTPEEFALRWLSNWQVPQEANGFIVNEPARAANLQSRVIGTWQQISGAQLNIDKFPARLLAIVNRPDLADKIGYGTAGTAGEGRFVFGLVEKTGNSCISMPFTVIFEYGIKGGSCSAVKAWHQRWKNLDTLPLGSPAYNTALEVITREFTEHGANPAQLPNQSALNQLRTNENALDPTWQLREFRLQGTGAGVPAGVLDLVTVKQTPADTFNDSAITAQYLNSNQAAVIAGEYVVPDRFPGVLDRFLGATSNVPFPPANVFWNADLTGLPSAVEAAETRRKFSLGTCNACHGGETATFFTHIGDRGMRSLGSNTQLSGFMTGTSVTLPTTNVSGGPFPYNDLAERKLKMADILSKSCFSLLSERRIPFVH